MLCLFFTLNKYFFRFFLVNTLLYIHCISIQSLIICNNTSSFLSGAYPRVYLGGGGWWSGLPLVVFILSGTYSILVEIVFFRKGFVEKTMKWGSLPSPPLLFLFRVFLFFFFIFSLWNRFLFEDLKREKKGGGGHYPLPWPFLLPEKNIFLS